MPRRAQIASYLTGAAVLLLLLALVAMHGQRFLYEYGWAIFIGIFAVAGVARVVEVEVRRRRLARFRRR